MGGSWVAIESACDAYASNSDANAYFAPRGRYGTGAWHHSMDTVCWCIKFTLALCADDGVVTKEEMQQGLPSPQQLATYGRKSPDTMGGDVDAAPWHHVVSPHLLAALACERHGMDDEALGFVAVIHDLNPNLGGDPKPTSHIMGYCLKGRVMARRGELKAAAGAFEEAVSRSEKYELWLLTAFALRDLKLFVLDDLGHGGHGSARLGAVLRRLEGSAGSLSAVLSGLDVAAMVQLEPPDSSYEVAYPKGTDDSPLGALRQELESMRLKDLRSRARGSGVDDDALEDAADSDDPKAAVVELLLAHAVEAQPPEDVAAPTVATPQSLESMKMSALSKRARELGVAQALLDAAQDSEAPRETVTELVRQATLAQRADAGTTGESVPTAADLARRRAVERAAQRKEADARRAAAAAGAGR